MRESLVDTVRARARFACEYCRLPESRLSAEFEIEHVIPKKHGGRTTLSNLAYSCLRCNRHKGPNLAGIDQDSPTSKPIALFNPRRHSWNRHFRWNGPYLVGRTAIGRVTVNVLKMNDPVRITLREELIEEGVFPSL
jgi:hypothetical protein